MRNKRHRRALSLLLAAALLAGQMGATVYGEEGTTGVTGGLCEHHPVHEDACGYVEAVAQSPCGHLVNGGEANGEGALEGGHTMDCYTDELICSLDENVEETATGSEAGHQHGQECRKLDCPHERGEHGADGGLGGENPCGYTEAVESRPCSYVCSVCGGEQVKDKGGAVTTGGNSPTQREDTESAATMTVTAFEELGRDVKVQTVLPGTPQSDLNLPATLGAYGYEVNTAESSLEDAAAATPAEEPITITGVTWELFERNGSPASYEEGRVKACVYWFRAALPEGYELDENTALPEIEVRYGWMSRRASAPNDANNDGYHDDDVAAVNAIISVNGLEEYIDDDGLQVYNVDDPAGWDGLVLWNSDTPRRITSLFVVSKGLRGTLDVSKCTKLGIILCQFNADLTGLTLGSNSSLTILQCNDTGITGELDLSGCPSLVEFWGSGTPNLTGVELGTHNNLDFFTCANSGIEGTLDVSGCANLDTVWCSNNPKLTELKLGTHNKLTDIACFNTGITGRLDVSAYSKLKTIMCNDIPGLTELNLGAHADLEEIVCYNTGITGRLDVSAYSKLKTLMCNDIPGLTELILGTHDDLTDFRCYNTGISGTFDLAGFPSLATLLCDGKSIVLQDGTIQAGPDGTVKVEFGYDLITDKDIPFTLTAMPDSGCVFQYWEGVPAGADHKANPLTFSPGTGYTYTANFLRIIPVTNVMLNHSSYTLYTDKEPRTFKLTAAVKPDDAYNKTVGWTTSDTGVATVDGDGNVTAVASGTAVITATTDDGHKTAACTVTVETGSQGYSGSGSGSDDIVTTTPQTPKPNLPVTVLIETPVTVDNGVAAGRLEDGPTADALAQAGKDPRAGDNGVAVQYDLKAPAAFHSFSITVPRETLDRLIAARVEGLTVNTGTVDLTFDLAALEEIQRQTTRDITLTAVRETVLTGEALAAIGSRPAYRLTVSGTDRHGQPTAVSSFGTGRVTLGLAYTPAQTEQTGGLFLVYGDGMGGVQWFDRSGYHRGSGRVMGSTGHFSLFGVGYRPAPVFADTADHWAKEDIDFAVSRGLMAGVSQTAFSPDSPVTRAALVTAMGRLAGIDPAAYPPTGRFADVPATASWAPFAEWAVSQGIVVGAGEQSFSPDGTITRQELALMMQRYADKLGYALPAAREGEFFADDSQITSSAYRSAIGVMQQAGVMSGKGSSGFRPKDTVTRAEAAAVLRRFAQIITDPAAAAGWAQNDAGNWLYYENSRPVTGWKEIESRWYWFDSLGLMEAGGWKQIGMDWYYFYPNGAMAANTAIDGYQVGPEGKRKE